MVYLWPSYALIVIYNIFTILIGVIPQMSLLLPTVKQLVCKISFFKQSNK